MLFMADVIQTASAASAAITRARTAAACMVAFLPRFAGRGARVGWSAFKGHKAGFAQAEETGGAGAGGVGATDDNVIKNTDSENPAGVHKLARDSDVLRAWGRIARGVRVGTHDGCSSGRNSATENFARRNEGGIQNAQRDKALVDDVVLGIEILCRVPDYAEWASLAVAGHLAIVTTLSLLGYAPNFAAYD